MEKVLVNDVVLLGAGLAGPPMDRILAEAGLNGMAFARPDRLARHVAQAIPAAAALVATSLAPAQRTRWTAILRQGPGLWPSTPIIEASPADTPAALRARLEQRTGPLDQPGFRDPAAADYRLVRLVGRDQADRLLASLGETLREALALAASGPVPISIAHRLAGLAGLYGYTALGQIWQAVETGESGALTEALAMTRSVLARLDGRFSRDQLPPNVQP